MSMRREPRRRGRRSIFRLLNIDSLESRRLLASFQTFIVTNTNDSGTGSLRQAILDSNNTSNVLPSAPNQILFDITTPGSGPYTISPTTALPTITNPVTIDGYSQSGSQLNKTAAGLDEQETDVAVLQVQIDGSGAGASANGLTIQSVGCTVDGLIITGFSGAGLDLLPGSPDNASAIGDDIWGNFIGVSSFDTHSSSLVTPGSNPLANGTGIAITSSNNRIGGSLPPSRNVIQGNNGSGVSLSGTAGTGNVIEGDYVLDNNADGVLITTSNNYIGEVIGSGPAGAGNIISGNTDNGIHILGSAALGNIVVNNEIGTDVGQAGLTTPIRGMNPRPNLLDGVLIEDAPGNYIGGLESNSFNVIAANGVDGVGIQNGSSQSATGNIVEGNKIGYNLRNGVISLLPNRDGINIDSSRNIIGGDSTSAENVIINNRRNGITISSQDLSAGNVEQGALPYANPSLNQIEGNFIGTQGGGDRYGNALNGVLIDQASDNTVGGLTSGALNVISANNDGIAIHGAQSTGNTIEGNEIGTMSDGKTVLGNAVDGIQIQDGSNTLIGGTASGAANVISGNNWGVEISGSTATGNLVQGNAIGTDLGGTVAIRNAVDGILIDNSASKNTIGGTDAAASNTIAYNVGNGVNVLSGTGNAILTNKIFSNNLLGIDLGGDGVTPNHVGFKPGPNDYQNYPVIITATSSGATTSVQGTLQSLPSTSYLIQFFANTQTTTSGYGQGQIPIGSLNVTTDASGNATFSASLSATVPQGELVTATATDLGNNDTSEFSKAVSSIPVAVGFSASSYSVNQTAGSITINVQRTGNPGSLVTVSYATGGGTAVAGTNYKATSGTLTFDPNEMNKSFTIPIIDTKTVGSNTTLDVTLSNVSAGASIGTPNPVVVTIVNSNQLTMQLSASSYSVLETAGGAVITVNRNSPATTTTVHYATAGGTASPVNNYTPVSGTLVFNPGQTSQSFTIPVKHDGLVTPALTVGITLSSPVGGSLGTPSTAVLTIDNVDQPGVLEFAGSRRVSAERQTMPWSRSSEWGERAEQSRWPTLRVAARPCPGPITHRFPAS